MTAVAATPRAAQARLKARLTDRPGYGSGGVLSVACGFSELCELWLADLALRDISEGTKASYRTPPTAAWPCPSLRPRCCAGAWPPWEPVSGR